MAVEKKRKERTTPFGVSLTRSQVLYRAAQHGSSLWALKLDQQICENDVEMIHNTCDT